MYIPKLNVFMGQIPITNLAFVQRPPRGIKWLESGINPDPKLRQTFQTQGSVTSGHQTAGPSDKVIQIEASWTTD